MDDLGVLGLGRDDRKQGLVEVRLSAHACPRCGCMVALDLADAHWSWHERLEHPGAPGAGDA